MAILINSELGEISINNNVVADAFNGCKWLKHNGTCKVKLIPLCSLDNVFKQLFTLLFGPLVVSLVDRDFVLLSILAQKISDNASLIYKHSM